MKQIKTVKFKERRASKMNNTQYNMQDLGYRFDEEALRSDHVKQMGFALPEDHADCYELISPFLVVAYHSGLNGESLTDLFPFIKESAPAVTATETQGNQEPKPLHTCDNDIIPGAALQGENRRQTMISTEEMRGISFALCESIEIAQDAINKALTVFADIPCEGNNTEFIKASVVRDYLDKAAEELRDADIVSGRFYDVAYALDEDTAAQP